MAEEEQEQEGGMEAQEREGELMVDISLLRKAEAGVMGMEVRQEEEGAMEVNSRVVREVA